jgi:hypothetical protein
VHSKFFDLFRSNEFNLKIKFTLEQMQKLFARLRSLLGIVLSAPAHEHTKTLAWFSQKVFCCIE